MMAPMRRSFEYLYAILASIFMLAAGLVLFVLIVVPLFIFVGSVFLPR